MAPPAGAPEEPGAAPIARSVDGDEATTSTSHIGPSPAGFSNNSPPSTTTSVVGKVLGGVGRFFGISGDDSTQMGAAAPSPASVSAGTAIAGPAAGTAAGGTMLTVSESPASAAAAAAAGIANVPHEADAVPVAGGMRLEGSALQPHAQQQEQRYEQGERPFDWQHVSRDHAATEGGVRAGTGATAAGAGEVASEDSLRGRSLSPGEVQLYSEKVDLALEVRMKGWKEGKGKVLFKYGGFFSFTVIDGVIRLNKNVFVFLPTV